MKSRGNKAKVTKNALARRPWNEWVIWVLWVFFEIVFLQATIASLYEYEPRASFIYGGIFISLLLGGIVTWFVRKNRLL
ncbi:MAG: hypothetical protein HON98_03380 [Chloroflexi bacterium]|nr:hypothetical protein [Chloroflexota bacterium]MBT3670400.1 hypothetical protein [Chloroflexota bacterium]MBT4003203.1 hypothetical protein [Chloroflexota bacterium]MBT4305587.1 hypothetical protein [Chloroflexota bacterium]MBT4533199.1 hypothetical protein [Chloroflexota bacterium]